VIQKAISEGAYSFSDIKACTKAGTGCGTCISTGPMPRLLAHTLKQLGKPKGVCKLLPFSEQEIVELVRGRQIKSFDAVLDQLSVVPSIRSAADLDEAKKVVGPILEPLFKKKGDGLTQVQQLKSLQADLLEFVNNINCAPIMVRLAWHDSGTYHKGITSWPECGGANGSIIYSPEINHGANNGLIKAVNYLRPFKEDYSLVSLADVIQMASAMAIKHTGGPVIKMRYGRKDAGSEACPGRQSRGTGDNAGLPDAEPPFGCGANTASQHLRNIFYRMGFDDKDIVALSGAHTLGRAFKERSGVVQEGYGEANGCVYTKSSAACPVRHDGKAGLGMPGGKPWTRKWLTFDNGYFKDYVDKDPNLLWMSTDLATHTDDNFKPHFQLYKNDQNAFFKDYADAHRRLSELGSKFEPPEGIVID